MGGGAAVSAGCRQVVEALYSGHFYCGSAAMSAQHAKALLTLVQ
jgi:hypothetical protein